MTTVVAEDSRLSVRALDMAPAIEGAMRALLGWLSGSSTEKGGK